MVGRNNAQASDAIKNGRRDGPGSLVFRYIGRLSQDGTGPMNAHAFTLRYSQTVGLVFLGPPFCYFVLGLVVLFFMPPYGPQRTRSPSFILPPTVSDKFDFPLFSIAQKQWHLIA